MILGPCRAFPCVLGLHWVSSHLQSRLLSLLPSPYAAQTELHTNSGNLWKNKFNVSSRWIHPEVALKGRSMMHSPNANFTLPKAKSQAYKRYWEGHRAPSSLGTSGAVWSKARGRHPWDHAVWTSYTLLSWNFNQARQLFLNDHKLNLIWHL